MKSRSFQGESFEISAPVSLSIFGEHMVAHGLPCIRMATSLRYIIRATRIPGKDFMVEYSESGNTFDLSSPAGRLAAGPEEMLEKVMAALEPRGVHCPSGFKFQVSASGARWLGLDPGPAERMCWIGALLACSGIDPMGSMQEIRDIASESAGDATHTSGFFQELACTELGGTLAFDAGNELGPEELRSLDGFMVGCSDKIHDATSIDRGNRDATASALKQCATVVGNFDLRNVDTDTMFGILKDMPDHEAQCIYAHIAIRDLCHEARYVLSAPTVEPHQIGRILDEQHYMLRDHLHLSSPETEAIVKVVKQAGALGCSIHGLSGAFVAYAPHRQLQVAKAVDRAGGTAVPVSPDDGIRIEYIDG